MATYHIPQARQGFDGISLIAFLLLGFGLIMVYRDITSDHDMQEAELQLMEINKPPAGVAPQNFDQEIGSGHIVPINEDLERKVAAPYDQYTLTQGLHGYTYGHQAIDISAGQGAIIKSPIDGYVSDLYTDQYGNPTLVIENDFYRVTLLHGKYKVMIGDQINLGQMLGRESNLGLTTDMQGRSCRNRSCGYHTHLNIYDKLLGENINPLELLE